VGQPESGASEQPECSAVGRHIWWGADAESARSIIIFADYIAAAVIANNSFANACLVHELAHVHDDFLRGVVMGFRGSHMAPSVNDWPGICAYFAEITWSEYAAETVGARHNTSEGLLSLMRNDPVHLSGIDQRLRQTVSNYKCRQLALGSLWQNAVTEMGDIFGNLGRAVARLALAPDYDEALAFLARPRNESLTWKPVVERLVRELEQLGNKAYADWGAAPFCGIQEVIAEGFHAVGLFPVQQGNDLHVSVV